MLQCSAGLVNTFVLLQQFEWALERRAFEDDLWVGARGAIALPTEAAREQTARMFRETSCFVITLGLAEVWFQKRKRPPRECAGESKGEGDETDVCDVLWRAVPSDRYDPKRHGFRVTSADDHF